MVAVPGGTFTMGSPASEAGRDADEGPQVEVTLKPFWIGKTEVTWDEYDQFAFVGNTGARTGDGGAGDSDAVSKPSRAYGDEAKGYGKGKMPALAMTQHAAMEYCRWLSQVTGKAYRLPTEAEWEYAARAGDTAARPADLEEQAWHSGNAKETPHKVGTKKPNAFGLYDMLGNVAEWTFDLYAENRYAEWGAEGHAAGGPADRQALSAPDAGRVVHRGGRQAALRQPAGVARGLEPARPAGAPEHLLAHRCRPRRLPCRPRARRAGEPQGVQEQGDQGERGQVDPRNSQNCRMCRMSELRHRPERVRDALSTGKRNC